MISETDYHRKADAALFSLMDALEAADESGALEAELQGGVLSVGLPGGRHYLVSKHAASGEIWVSSPLSGGLHFRASDGGWSLPDGRALQAFVLAEIAQLAGAV